MQRYDDLGNLFLNVIRFTPANVLDDGRVWRRKLATSLVNGSAYTGVTVDLLPVTGNEYAGTGGNFCTSIGITFVVLA